MVKLLTLRFLTVDFGLATLLQLGFTLVMYSEELYYKHIFYVRMFMCSFMVLNNGYVLYFG